MTPTAIACCRITDEYTRYIPGSIRANCSRCNHLINVSPSSVQIFAQTNLPYVCMECVTNNGRRKIEQVGLNQQQLREIRQYLAGQN